MNLEVVEPSNITPAINLELLQFFSQFHTSGWVDLKIDRLNDFFGLYKTQSDQFRTYVMRNQQSGKIEACASFIARDVKLGDEIQKIAYATDLRVSSSRRAILEWSQHFLPTMEDVKTQMGVQHFFSFIDFTETAMTNIFLRPRNMRRTLPRYYLYRKFKVNTLHGRFPWAPAPISSLRIREGNESNLDALLAYLFKKFRFRPFASVWDGQSFEKKIRRLTGFNLSDFLIAFDRHDQIVGCLSTWSPQLVQKFIPYSFELHAHNFRQFLKFGQLLGWSHPLAKPVKSTGKETPLAFRWLTNLAIDNEDVFESLLWRAYEQLNKNEFLAYTHIEPDFRTRPPKAWISAQLPYSMYSIMPPTQEIPAFLHPSEVMNPEIEGIFI